MKRYFTKTFLKFLFGFLVIIIAAFSVITIVATQLPKSVDNVALPQ